VCCVCVCVCVCVWVFSKDSKALAEGEKDEPVEDAAEEAFKVCVRVCVCVSKSRAFFLMHTSFPLCVF
jgi:hypothetical protein